MEMSRDIVNRQSASRTSMKTPTHNVQKRLRYVRRQYRNSLLIKPRQTLRQDFSQRHAQRPDVRAGRRSISRRLRWIIRAGLSRNRKRFACLANTIAREFQLVAGGHDVGGLHVSVDIPLAVKKAECLQRGIEHLTGFFCCESALGYDLRQVLFRVFHHREDKVSGVQTAASGLEDPDQVRMR